MENQYRAESGHITFVSKPERARREAVKNFKTGNFELAYLHYKEAFDLGSTDRKTYLGLVNTCKILCATTDQYCDEIKEWQMVVDRLQQD